MNAQQFGVSEYKIIPKLKNRVFLVAASIRAYNLSSYSNLDHVDEWHRMKKDFSGVSASCFLQTYK